MKSYHCEAFDIGDNRIGGFVVRAATMSEALLKASTNIEVVIRPHQHTLRVTTLLGDDPEGDTNGD